MERENAGPRAYENAAAALAPAPADPQAPAFRSILSPSDTGPPAHAVEAPPSFHDLNLDQLVQSIVAPYADYDLASFFHDVPLDLDVIVYRQEVMQDLESPSLMAAVREFSQGMHDMRVYLPRENQHYYRYQKERSFLHAVQIYGDAVAGLARDLAQAKPRSRGMRALQRYVADYAASPAFAGTVAQAQQIETDLSAIRYCLLLKDGSVTVRRCAGEADFGVEIEAAFEKFRRGVTKDYHAKLQNIGGMNHIEAQIVERVALLFPAPFRALDAFIEDHAWYLDPKLAAFDREVHFYVAYLAHVAKLREAGLPFCYPQVSDRRKEIVCRDTFDIVLADKLVGEKSPVVRNDFFLRGAERIIVVSGPNHGGKTTLARLFGQVHYLAHLGCAVPGSEARLFLFDRLFTHFEREEDLTNLRGKLQDDLVRIRAILDRATPNSVLIMNEIFSSTTLQDAVYLSEKIMTKLSDLDVLCVWVTFLDELASFNEKTVSMVSTVSPENPAIRTFKLERRPANGLAYALSIAEKYRVTREWIRRRLGT